MTLTRIVGADKGPVVKEKINAIMDEVENGGDMLASTYDPVNGARQVAFGDEVVKLTGDQTITGNKYFLNKIGVGITAPVSRTHIYEDTSEVGNATGLIVEQDGAGDAVIQILRTLQVRWKVGSPTSGDFVISNGALTNPLLRLTTGGVLFLGSNGINDAWTSWTPEIVGATSGTANIISTVGAAYKQIGKTVYVKGRIGFQLNTMIGEIRLNIPFGTGKNSWIFASITASNETVPLNQNQGGASLNTAHIVFLNNMGVSTIASTNLTAGVTYFLVINGVMEIN